MSLKTVHILLFAIFTTMERSLPVVIYCALLSIFLISTDAAPPHGSPLNLLNVNAPFTAHQNASLPYITLPVSSDPPQVSSESLEG